MDYNDKRELIKKIKLDKNLTEQEKSKKIQEIMMGNYTHLLDTNTKSNEAKTCSHYDKQCYKFYHSCCNVYDPCKRCHIERNCCTQTGIKITSITCSQCEHAQVPSNTCTGCGIKFANSYCAQCQIWTFKQILHCDKCGICRIGTKETLFHCDECGICFISANDKVEHKCIKTNANIKATTNIAKSDYKEGICVICSENTFNSQSESFPLDCGHFIHKNCFSQYIQQGNYKCPCCRKSIGEMKEHWRFIREQIKSNPLPNDFFPINQNDIVDSDYGKFKIIQINQINGKLMYLGEFVDWINKPFGENSFEEKVLGSTYAYGTLGSDSVKKNLYKKIHCNDCGNKSVSPFHFYGLECGVCSSFNTQE
jgi:hypothetical protein